MRIYSNPKHLKNYYRKHEIKNNNNNKIYYSHHKNKKNKKFNIYQIYHSERSLLLNQNILKKNVRKIAEINLIIKIIILFYF